MVKVAAVLALPLLLMSMVASSNCLIVDIKERGPSGMHIIVPVPLAFAQVALSFVPDELTRFPCPEAAEYIPMAQRVAEELADIPDGELVRVEERHETVVVSKVDESLEVEVHNRNEDVSIVLPLKAAVEILESFDGETLEVASALAALRKVSRTNLVHVRDGDEEVKVWIW